MLAGRELRNHSRNGNGFWQSIPDNVHWVMALSGMRVAK